jgi:hypothetical protein
MDIATWVSVPTSHGILGWNLTARDQWTSMSSLGKPSVVVGLLLTSESLYPMEISLQVTFLEVEVHVRQIHLVWVHVGAPLGLAPLGLEVLVLVAVGDN